MRQHADRVILSCVCMYVCVTEWNITMNHIKLVSMNSLHEFAE